MDFRIKMLVMIKEVSQNGEFKSRTENDGKEPNGKYITENYNNLNL